MREEQLVDRAVDGKSLEEIFRRQLARAGENMIDLELRPGSVENPRRLRQARAAFARDLYDVGRCLQIASLAMSSRDVLRHPRA